MISTLEGGEEREMPFISRRDEGGFLPSSP
jgi:hypothetical protein